MGHGARPTTALYVKGLHMRDAAAVVDAVATASAGPRRVWVWVKDPDVIDAARLLRRRGASSVLAWVEEVGRYEEVDTTH